MATLLALVDARHPRLAAIADEVALALICLNVLLIASVVLWRLRDNARSAEGRRSRAGLAEIVAQLEPGSARRDERWLRRRIDALDVTERTLAAELLIARLESASPEERGTMRGTLDRIGAVELIADATNRRFPWKRALAIRTLGWLGASEQVPLLLGRLDDRNRYVRESAVRALGRIADRRALPALACLFREPGRVAPGVVYDALVSLGGDAAPVFVGALRSPLESVRIASCYGVAAVLEPERARPELQPLLDDEAARVRAAAADALGLLGGSELPAGLARATRDELTAVRNAAVGALGSYDDPSAVPPAVDALLDPNRDTAIKAAESLVRLSRRERAGSAATRALAERRAFEWPVERALTDARVRAGRA